MTINDSQELLSIYVSNTFENRPGCFERIYEEVLYYELTKLGLNVQRQGFAAY